MDSAEDTEPRKFFCFDGCLVKLNGKELEIQTAELMGGSVPRATYKFLAEGASFSSFSFSPLFFLSGACCVSHCQSFTRLSSAGFLRVGYGWGWD